MSQCRGPALRWQDFIFGLHLCLARRYCESLQSVRGPAQCKSGPGNNIVSRCNDLWFQSCTSAGRFGSSSERFGPGLGLKLTKISVLIWAWDVFFVLGAQKCNQNKFATLLNFSDLTWLSVFFGHDLGFRLVFGFGPGSSLYFRIRAGFGPGLVGPFTTLYGTFFNNNSPPPLQFSRKKILLRKKIS